MAYPIYPGMDIKFQVTTGWEDFHLTDGTFQITIKDNYGRVVRTLAKDDCFWDSDGRFYFTIEKVRRGVYWAFFKGTYEDEDYDDQRATVTDEQQLIVVPSVALAYGRKNTKLSGRCRCHKVHYQLVTTVSIDGDEYLADCDGRYILTSDNKRICFKSDKAQQIDDMSKVRLETMTGDQFKQFIEGNNPNGAIDTVPEMMRAAQGISDDETIQHDVDERIEQGLQQNMGTRSDIDEIFED